MFVPSGINRVNSCTPFNHQTDSEQRVIEMPFLNDHNVPDRPQVTHGGHPRSLAPRGHHLMFALDAGGVPAQGLWIYRH